MTKTVAVLLAFLSLLVAMPMPETGTTPPNAVPVENVQKVALAWAATEYPGARLGTVVPYVDENGAAVAWMFHFRTDGKPFPGYDEVAADVQAERQTLTRNTDLTRWRSKYSHMLVSARTDRVPVVSFGYGTSEYYAIAGKALERAQAVLGPDAQLSRIYFVSPSTYLEFENPAHARVVLSQHFERMWDSREDFSQYVAAAKAEMNREFPEDEAAVAAIHEREWQHATRHERGSFSEVFVPNVELAPFYDWSYGCTPTSGAMVCGYVDRLQKSGRLVDWFYQRRDNVEGENDFQIPNVQLECAIEMHTDTSTGGTNVYNVSNGLFQVGYGNDYTAWSVTNTVGNSGNDWAWGTLTSEIDAGHAMIWSAIWEVHSLAGFGYRTDDKYVYVHNTWYQPAEWWTHSGSGISHVAAVSPDAGDEHNTRITYPLGDTFYNSSSRGEKFYIGDTCRIAWENGTPATTVDIDISTDGGRNWETVVAGVADSGAYHWYIPPSVPTCDSVRLRLSQYNGTTLTSADGTFGCFHTYREPVPPPQTAPPNGLPIMNPPVVLMIDTTGLRCDSLHFRLIQGLDTIWEQNGAATSYSLPDTLFSYNKTYKWIVRGHNRWGWGNWSTPWSFRILFHGIEEADPARLASGFSVPAVNRLGGSVLFDVRMAAPGSRLTVFDALGNVVRELPVARPGRIAWDATNDVGRRLAAGLYFVRLSGQASQTTCKILLLD